MIYEPIMTRRGSGGNTGGCTRLVVVLDETSLGGEYVRDLKEKLGDRQSLKA